MATTNAATNYLEKSLLNFLFKNNPNSFATPGNSIYVGLATAVTQSTGSYSNTTGETDLITITEVTGSQDSAYARQQVTAANWAVEEYDAGTDNKAHRAKNSSNIEFPPHGSGGSTYTVTHVFIATASTGTLYPQFDATNGNVLFVGKLDVDKSIAVGDIFRINSNNLTVELR